VIILLPRERVRLAIDHMEPDRAPIHDTVWQATIDRWRNEGLPSGITPEDYFGYEIVGYGSDTSPRFREEILSENDEYIVEKDSFGGVRKNHRDFTTTPMIIDYPCKSQEDWEQLKPRLEPDDRRVNCARAPVTREFAEKIYADAATSDAVEGVKIISDWFK